jgi:HD-GYP domain-containing protein (c-di-GMP phosphodiesterase class II)
MDSVERLVGDLRARQPRRMEARERTIVWTSALAYTAAAVALALALPWSRPVDPWVVVLLLAMFVAIDRIHFEIGSVTAVAVPLVFVPMLFLLPLPLVPLLAPAGYLIATLPDYVQRKKHIDRWIYCLPDAWFTIGPVLVLGLLADGKPRIAAVGIYALAFVASVITDAVPNGIRERFARGVTLREHLKATLWISRVDAVLWPIGLLAAISCADHPIAIVGVGPLVWLLGTFARERKERYSAALELNRAYRGTVMLLSDVVEADDNYTADHCRGVVTLVNAVADELEIDSEARQELEFVALLHDVGKIVIPKEILNKPGALSDDEFELMKTHTIEGQVLLDRVGGLLGRVGAIVRSCHERWDGQGYPDGLAGYEIPLAARIVFACDAYNAMTTDRPYRAAMSQETAVEELWQNAGSQFDPRIVAALATVIRRGLPSEPSPARAVRAVLAGNGVTPHLTGSPPAALPAEIRSAKN